MVGKLCVILKDRLMNLYQNLMVSNKRRTNSRIQ